MGHTNVKKYYRAGLFYNDLNLKLTLFTLAFITPRANFNLPPIREAFYVIQKVRNWKNQTQAFFRQLFVLVKLIGTTSSLQLLLTTDYCNYYIFNDNLSVLRFNPIFTIRIHFDFVVSFSTSATSIFSNSNSTIIFSRCFPIEVLIFFRMSWWKQQSSQFVRDYLWTNFQIIWKLLF